MVIFKQEGAKHQDRYYMDTCGIRHTEGDYLATIRLLQVQRQRILGMQNCRHKEAALQAVDKAIMLRRRALEQLCSER